MDVYESVVSDQQLLMNNNSVQQYTPSSKNNPPLLKQRSSPNKLQYIHRSIVNASPQSAPAMCNPSSNTTISPRSIDNFMLSQPPIPRSQSPHKLYTNTSNGVDVYPELHYSAGYNNTSNISQHRTSRTSPPNKLSMLRNLSDPLLPYDQPSPRIQPQSAPVNNTSPNKNNHTMPYTSAVMSQQIIRTEQQLYTHESVPTRSPAVQHVPSPIIPYNTLQSANANNKKPSKLLYDSANSNIPDNDSSMPFVSFVRSQSVSIDNVVPTSHVNEPMSAKLATQSLHARNGSKSNRRLKSPINALHTSQSLHDGILLSPPQATNTLLTVPSPPTFHRSQSQPHDNLLLSPLKHHKQLQRKLAITTQQSNMNNNNELLTSPKSAFLTGDQYNKRYDSKRRSGTYKLYNNISDSSRYTPSHSDHTILSPINQHSIDQQSHNRNRFSFSSSVKPAGSRTHHIRPQSVFVTTQQRPPVIVRDAPNKLNIHERSKSAAPMPDSVNTQRMKRIKSPSNMEQQNNRSNYIAWMNQQQQINQNNQHALMSAPTAKRPSQLQRNHSTSSNSYDTVHTLEQRVQPADKTFGFDIPSPLSHRNNSARTTNNNKYHFSGRFKSDKQRMSPTESMQEITKDIANYGNMHTTQSVPHSLHSLYKAQNDVSSNNDISKDVLNYSSGSDPYITEDIIQHQSPKPTVRVVRISEIDEALYQPN